MSQENEKEQMANLKMEIAEKLGLAQKVKELGWGGLTAAESGRVGGLMSRRLRQLKESKAVGEKEAADGS